MPDDKNTGEFGRREFMKLSGGVGAAAVVGVAAPGVVKGLASPPGNPDYCGNTMDSGSRYHLWVSAQKCKSQSMAGGDCLAPPKIGTYVVLPGVKNQPIVNHNKLLVPTERVKGIECYKLWNSLKGNHYWDHAWNEGKNKTGGGYVTVTGGHQLALGVNSQAVRMQEHLHIHMAEMMQSNVPALDAAYNGHRVATHPKDWFNPKYTVSVGGRNYRVLWVPNLNQIENDPFVVLANRYNGNSGHMAEQTLVVTSRSGGGFYVLNSNTSTGDMKGGTSTCDGPPHPGLLVYS